MNLIDKQNGIRLFLKPGQNPLQARFEIAAKLCAREQRSHIECVDNGILQCIGDLATGNLQSQSLGDGRFSHSWIADVDRIVLAPTAKHMDGSFDLVFPADQGIDISLPGLLDAVKNTIATDVPSGRLAELAAAVQGADMSQMRRIVLQPPEYMRADPFSSAGYILIPDLDAIRAIGEQLLGGETATPSAEGSVGP